MAEGENQIRPHGYFVRRLEETMRSLARNLTRSRQRENREIRVDYSRRGEVRYGFPEAAHFYLEEVTYRRRFWGLVRRPLWRRRIVSVQATVETRGEQAWIIAAYSGAIESATIEAIDRALSDLGKEIEARLHKMMLS
ncbi:MAG: hypothetical protein AAB360_03625 [Patescibacteria group bacterium]